MKTLALVGLLFGTFAFAQPSLQKVHCESESGIQIDIEVDVLESNPPQSSINIVSRDGIPTGFSAFTQVTSIETNPPIDQWTWVDHNNTRRIVVESRDGLSGNGTYFVGRMRGIELSCTLN